MKTVSEADQSQAISVLTLAFASDPMTRWSLADPVKYLEAYPSVAMAFGGKAFTHASAYLAEGGAGAALWLPPGVGPDEEALGRLFEENAPENAKDDLPLIFEQVVKHYPAEPYWYLPIIGVDPARQGEGVGSSLLKEALKAVDRDGTIAYLESSNIKNVPLYERFGFEVIGEIQSGSSPVLRPMLRKANGG